MNWHKLIERCPPLRWLRNMWLWTRGGAERPEAWQGTQSYLRKITYHYHADDEEVWAKTGHHWRDAWILSPLRDYLKPSWHVLEIGCGPGRLLAPLASMFTHVIGIDFSSDMVQYAQKRLKDYSNIEVIQNDGRTIPLPARSIDFIVSVIAFQHMNREHIHSYFKEAHRVLKDDGFFRFQTRHDIQRRNAGVYDRHFLTRAEVEKLATTYNFEILSYESGLGHLTWHWFTLRKKC